MNSGKHLSDLIILDLSQYEAGTSCTQMLGWLGAKVIKIEKPGTGEGGRHLFDRGTPGEDDEYFLLMNANKQSVTLNLKTEKGKKIFIDLVKKSDIVVENFSYGVMDRLGFSYEKLKEVNSEIILATIRGFGSSGPWKKFKSFDPVAQATGGTLSITGCKDGPPIRPNAFIGDTGAGLLCVIAILTAVIHRNITGKGQFIDISQQDSVLHFTRPRLASTLKTGKPAPRSGNIVLDRCPANLYKCKPGGPNDYVLIHTTGEARRMWDNILKIIGREDLIGDECYYNPDFRAKNREKIDSWIENWTSKKNKYEAMEIMAEKGIPCGACLDTKEVLENKQLLSRDMIRTINHPVKGKINITGIPIRFSNYPIDVNCPPLLGQHTKEILREFLNYTDEQIDQLIKENIL